MSGVIDKADGKCTDGHSPSLEPIATLALDAGRILMETGGSAKNVERIVETVAHGLGAERIDVRIGYASLAITIGIGESGITRMRKVGALGANERLRQQLWDLAKRVSHHEETMEQARRHLARLPTETGRHNPRVIAVAVGAACAAFGRLLGVDWYGTGPVFLAATAGQYIRGNLISCGLNPYICAAVVSFVSSALGGLGAQWSGSETVTMATISPILLLVPGVPALNAQSDILEGYPTLGSARIVTVVMTLIFIGAGLWLEQALSNFVLKYWY
jgi:uncharacterized membrane protein YjjP (DUF1212 family)